MHHYHNDEMLACLKEIRDNGPIRKNIGICQNAADLYHEKYGVMVSTSAFENLMAEWPKWSGNTTFPIPSPHGGLPCNAYLNATEETMWNPEHPYGALRLELLDWLIEVLS